MFTKIKFESTYFLLPFYCLITIFYFSFIDAFTFRDNTNFFYVYSRLNIYDIPTSFFFSRVIGWDEPISFLSALIFSVFLDWKSFVILKGGILLTLSHLLLKKKNVNILISLLIVCLNFYLMRLNLELHKFSIAYIFLIAALLSEKNTRLLLILAGLSHFQVFIIIAPALLFEYLASTANERKKINKILPLALFLSYLIFSIIFDDIYDKILKYLDLYYIDFIVALSFTLLIFLLFNDQRSNFLFYMLVILSIAILFLGGSRLNIFLAFIPIYFLKGRILFTYLMFFFSYNLYLLIKWFLTFILI
jgi:hypothetical protein